MRKFLGYIILLNCISYFFVFIFNSISNINEKNEIEYVSEIKLLKTATNEVVNMNFEDYIKGVTYAEMPASFEIEALKAQAVAARTYTYRKIGQQAHDNGDICDNPAHCQAFREKEETENYKKVSDAVDDTKGEVITYDGNVINALFHASSGGKTESANEVWNSNKICYLSSVDSPGEEEIMKDFITEVVVEKNELMDKLKMLHKDFIYNEKINILKRNESGRVTDIQIGNMNFSGVEVRNTFELRSANFEVVSDEDKIKFIVKGYGHGVGLSQWGAQAMALKNKDYKEILKHYYLGTEIEKAV